jgi:hypothetical protein
VPPLAGRDAREDRALGVLVGLAGRLQTVHRADTVTPDRNIRIGFTGTRTGMSLDQYETVRSLLMLAASDADVEVHHGDCVGADEDVHDLCEGLGVAVIIHPPKEDRLRAFCHGAIRLEPRKPYLKRNHAIVDATDFLIATPRESRVPRPARGQGTWSTVRYAEGHGRVVYVVWPSGDVLVENFESRGSGTSMVRRVLGMLADDARAAGDGG